MGKSIDESGNEYFGNVVLGYAYTKNTSRHYYTACGECGEIFVTRPYSLKTGHTKSCGCLHSKISKAIAYDMGKNMSKDLTGKRFGSLTVLEKTDRREHRSVVWKCRCDCGKIIYRRADVLGHQTTSCGCRRESKGEECIRNILESNNIKFEVQKKFKDLPNNLRFDFFIENSYVIEFDGMQHFECIEHWGGEEGLKKRQLYDQQKNTYCFINNIPIIRIPYWHNDIQLEDLKVETTKFLLKEGI